MSADSINAITFKNKINLNYLQVFLFNIRCIYILYLCIINGDAILKWLQLKLKVDDYLFEDTLINYLYDFFQMATFLWIA